MENPMSPMENQDPLEKQDPLDDPLLDALERSIENPPGFVDPVASNDVPFMDDVAKQLDQAEASIENISLPPPRPDIVKDTSRPEEQEDKEDKKAPLPALIYEPPKTTEEKWGTFRSSPPLPQEGSAHTPPPNPPLSKPHGRGGTGIRSRSGLRLKGHANGRVGRTRARISSDLRICPESNETISIQECEKCEKYRHWPEGTDEEPRECWYDWQARQPSDASDDDSHEEQ